MPDVRTHYHVIGATPGYLSEDDDPGTYLTYEDAQVGLEDAKEFYLDDGLYEDGQYTVEGSVEEGYYFIGDTTKTYDLGYLIEIVECEEAACFVEEA